MIMAKKLKVLIFKDPMPKPKSSLQWLLDLLKRS